MNTNKLIFQKEQSNYCAYCNTITFQDVYTDETEENKIVICKTCEMEAAQLVLFPQDTKEKGMKHFNNL